MPLKNGIELKPDGNNGRKLIFPDNKEIIGLKTKEADISKGKEISAKLGLPLIECGKDGKYRNRINPQKRKIKFSL